MWYHKGARLRLLRCCLQQNTNIKAGFAEEAVCSGFRAVRTTPAQACCPLQAELLWLLLLCCPELCARRQFVQRLQACMSLPCRAFVVPAIPPAAMLGVCMAGRLQYLMTWYLSMHSFRMCGLAKWCSTVGSICGSWVSNACAVWLHSCGLTHGCKICVQGCALGP
jgi:hypothetical protein